MADILKLKKKAADFEAKKQMDKALATYREMIEVYESGEEDPIDIPLYNRVGDLLQKSGNLADAVSLWERAVDHYADGGFYNPAIALCNKILRQSPGRAVVYYKLGKISAEKGFKADARENFLEYASRMQKAGNLNEAFRALKEFADLVPDQDDVRLMLADQLVKADRKEEAIEQLQIVYTQLTNEGRSDEAEAVATKMRAIDPTVEPKAADSGSSSKGGGLVFLDLEPSGGPAARRSRATKGTPAAEVRRATKAVAGLDLLDTGIPIPAAASAAPAKPMRPPPAPAPPAAAPPAPAPPAPPAPAPPDLVILPTEIVTPPPRPRASLAGLETTSLTEPVAAPETSAADDLQLLEEPSASSPDLPLIESAPSAAPPAGLLFLDDAPAAAPPADLPLLEEPPVPATAEHAVLADRPLLDEPALPSTAERAIPSAPAYEAPPDAPLLEVQTSDFGTFGTPADAQPAAAGFDSLEIESSEGVHALPLGDSYADELPSLGEEAPPSPLAGTEEPPFEPPEPMRRETSTVLADSVDSLRVRAAATPEDWGLRRHLAEALLDDGQREEGIAELEVSLAGYERDGDLDTAASISEEIVRLAPSVIRYHQKRVEFAFRASDRQRLAEAYVELADALLKDGQAPKARVVYQRVLEISPDDLRAQAALETIADAPLPEPTPTARRSVAASRKSTMQPAPKAASRPAAKKADEEEFVSLGDWLREDEEPKSTRMVVEEKEPTGDEQADFADMLRKFKQGVSNNVDEEDHEAHYDLGVAYKEMGLLDEAISEFQKALRGSTNRVRAIEALGLCFVEKAQLPMAATILQRALSEPGVRDDSLIGVLYLLGTISQELHLFPDAKRYYDRVFAVDIQFRDVGDRMNAVEKALK